MLAHKGRFPAIGRAIVATTIAVFALTMAEPPAAFAGASAPRSSGVSAATTSSEATDFSSARRRRHVRRGNNNAAGLAFMGMAIGTIGAIAAQQRRRDYYNNGYGYGYGPGYYGGPQYYGGGPYYGRRYYRPY
jgi:hypothetical protein